MRLEDIIKATRTETVEKVLPDELIDIDKSKIMLYAEHSVSTDTEYKFIRSKRINHKILKIGNINYERLCSLHTLDVLVKLFLSRYKKKEDEILVIEVIDYIYQGDI